MQQAKKRCAYRDIPIIMLTARDEVRDKVEGLEIGADDYVIYHTFSSY